MDRKDLRDVARIRLKEARLLLQNRYYDGAYYLAGYVVECALKACIAKQIKLHEFPDKDTIVKSYSHNLFVLFNVAGLWQTFQQDKKNDNALQINWSTVKDWKPESRYRKSTLPGEAQDLYSAIANRQHGVLRWIRQHW